MEDIMTVTDQTWAPSDTRLPDGRRGQAQDRLPQQRRAEYSQPQRKQEHGQSDRRNVSPGERGVSVAAGAIAALLGLARRDLAGCAIATVGSALVYRGATGRCPLYSAMHIDT